MPPEQGGLIGRRLARLAEADREWAEARTGKPPQGGMPLGLNVHSS